MTWGRLRLLLILSAALLSCRGERTEAPVPAPAPAQAPATAAAAVRPNVLFITVDTLRADRLGCYGFERARTPHVDRLAADGVRVQEARAATPLTLPSHATLMTGLQPPAHGARNNGHALTDEVQTLAERLKSEGYQTQAFVSAEVLHRRFNLDQGFDGYDDELSAERVLFHERSGKETVDRVTAWLDARPSEQPETAPFFLWVHLFDPHWPYTAPAADARNAATPYDAEITTADRQVGRILDSLKRKHLLDDTLIVFTSDHGESLGEHGEASHAILIYECTIRVPLIFRYPRRLPAAKVYPGPVRGVDVMPTLLGLLGVSAQKSQGLDLSEALLGRAAAPAVDSYAESLFSAEVYGAAPLHGLRSEQWTYIRAPRRELYDRKSDPNELRNLLGATNSDSPKARAASERAETLDARLQVILEESAGMGFATEATPVDAQTAEMLRALGYAEGAKASGGLDGMDAKDVVQIDARVDRGVQLFQEKKPAEAAAVLERLLVEYPGLSNARHILARGYRKAGDPASAARHYQELLKQSPDDPELYVQLGQLELRSGDGEQAAKHLTKALSLSPDSVNALMLTAELKARQGHEDDAKRLYEKVIEIDPDMIDAYLAYGQFLYAEHDFEQALRVYQKSLELAPGHFLGNLQAGVCALQLRKLDLAESHFEQASRSDPRAWQPTYNIACIHALKGEKDAAYRDLEAAIDKGFSNFASMPQNPCWTALRHDPRFRSLPSRTRAGAH